MSQLLNGAAAACSVFIVLGFNASAQDGAPKTASLHEPPFNFEHVSCTGAENEIRVVVKKVKDSVGLISADLFPNKQEGFLRGRGRIAQVKFAARAPVTNFCMRAPEEGMFAIALYHDENASGRLDKGTFGIPAEPWGISNNPKVRFSAPPVESAIFDVSKTEGAKVEIELN